MTNGETVFGIDLGTTNSSIAFIQNGKPFICKIDGSYLVPSVLSTNGRREILVGQPAVNQSLLSPEQTIYHIKRKMGNEEVVVFNGESFTPQMLSSLILKRLKQAAEQISGVEVKKVVISVPAFFNEQQRQATQEAGELAGFEVLRLLNEPTSAALSYALSQSRRGLYLVYDLGGGTFDVSIVDLASEVMEVRASCGDTHLGGADFDELIVKWLEEKFAEKHNTLISDAIGRIRLKRAAEKAKIRLSTELRAEIMEEAVAHDSDGVALHLQETLTRPEFEHMITLHLEKTLQSVNQALKEASCTKDDIDHVIFVGGATHTPLVTQMLEEHLGVVPQAWIDPSTAVVEGTAIEAANMTGQTLGSKMVDITPHSLGVGVFSEYYEYRNHILIHRNTPLPMVASHVFYKMAADANRVEIEVFQGEFSNPSANTLLGKFSLENLEETENTEVLIKFTLDKSGLLRASVEDLGTQKKVEKEIHRRKKERTVHANLADLSMVRMQEEEDISFEPTLLDGKIEEISLSSELEKRVENLLGSGNLDREDRGELQRTYNQAKEGEDGATEHLEELVYYLD
ncbi:MAG: Chaperone protein DnaK [Chlamydiae bacterium]|nr:Chaperone protein DnaK [Chlamydiota bacterium]